MPEVMEIAKKIVSRGPKSIRLVKQVAREGLLSDFDTGCLIETRGYVSLLGNEGAEGIRAFLEKREPKW
jgi:enoyl-CoA hydratase/carnithine racemase